MVDLGHYDFKTPGVQNVKSSVGTHQRALPSFKLFLFRHLILKILIVNIPALTLGLSQDFERYTADNPSS